MMSQTISTRPSKRYGQIAAIAAVVVALGGGVGLLGWILDIPSARSLFSGLATMKFNTALLFVLAGPALWFRRDEGVSPMKRAVGLGFVWAIVILALLTLAEYVFHADLHIDQAVVRDLLTNPGIAPPGRMSVATNLCFLFAGLALLVTGSDDFRGHLAEVFAVLVITGGLMGGMGYLFGVKALYRFYPFSSMALLTAVMFVVLGLGVLTSRPAVGVMASVSSDKIGGVIARWLLPCAVAFSIFMGWVRLVGERHGYYDTEVGTVILAIVWILAISVVILFCARLLNRLHAELEQRYLASARLAAIVESSVDAVIGKDLTGVVTNWNDGAERIFGYSPSEMIGRSIMEVVPSELRDNEAKMISQIRQGERVEHFETTGMRKDGTLIQISVSISPIKDAQGRIVGASKVVRDVTERIEAERALRVAEEQLRIVVENLSEGLVLADLGGRLLHWNPAALKMHGFSEESDLSRPLEELAEVFELSTLDGRQLSLDEWPIARVLNGETLHGVTIRLRRRGHDRSRVFQYSGTVVEYAENRKIAFVSIEDISELKGAEEALRRQAQDLRRSNRDLEQFAYVASHDLQEPLRAVAGCLQLLERRYKGELDERADELIGHAVDGAVRMRSLIEGLLAFSRVGTRGGDFVPVDCGEVVDQAWKNLSAAVGETGANITCDTLPVIRGDKLQLVLLFQNLIGNAIKFRADEPPRIHVGAKRENGFWTISVEDNGIGIDSDYFDRIFAIFQRLHTRREYPGTGLGLAICKKIVERHGGTISVESTLGKGSVFQCRFPV